MTVTFLAIKSSIARTCNAGSALVGPIIMASTPSLAPSSLMPVSMALNHGMPPIFTTTPIVGLSAAKAPVASTVGESDARQQGASGCREFHHDLTFLPLFAARANCGSIDPTALDQTVTQNSV